jgi:CheY-like chemotaxis protein
MTSHANRILLRAEVVAGDDVAVGHTLSVSSDGAFIEIARRPEVGAKVRVRLSFPRLFQPVERAATVVAHVNGTGPGGPSGIEVELLHANAEERDVLERLMVRLERSAPRAGADLRYRVLVVEDNAFIRDMFAYGVDKYFRTHHAQVTVEMAADGGEAWEKIREGSYDLAIVDHYLPVLDGTALLTRVRSEPRLADLPIVGISVGGSDVREAMLGAGADLFIGKPVMLRDLFETLERLATAQAGA